MEKEEIKTLADFKRLVQIGRKVAATFHRERAGIDEGTGKVLYKDKDMGIREVSIRQTNSFACKTTKTDGTIADSWCEWPKASQCVIKDNVVTITVTQDNVTIPILSYWVVKENVLTPSN